MGRSLKATGDGLLAGRVNGVKNGGVCDVVVERRRTELCDVEEEEDAVCAEKEYEEEGDGGVVLFRIKPNKSRKYESEINKINIFVYLNFFLHIKHKN